MLINDLNLEHLISMNKDDLREFMLDKNFNKQELKELIFRLIDLNKSYVYQLKSLSEENNKIKSVIKDEISDVKDDLSTGFALSDSECSSLEGALYRLNKVYEIITYFDYDESND